MNQEWIAQTLMYLRTIRALERQQKADALQSRAARMPAHERMEYITQHPEYGGSRG